MKTLIAISGRISSGKSKAIELLKHRKFNGFNFNYIDLDIFCKGVKDSLPEIREFFIKYCDHCDPSAKLIIENIIKNPVKEGLYEEYCEFFNTPIKSYLESLDDGVYIIEASAIFSYPDIMDMMHHIIVVDPEDNIRNNNLAKRNLTDVKIFDKIFERNLIANYDRNLITMVHLKDGTLLELRAKIELALISYLSSLEEFKNDYLQSFQECLEIIKYFNDYDSHAKNPYHNLNHAISVLTDLVLSGDFTRVDGLTALYHDCYYEPMEKLNEQKSAAKVRIVDISDDVTNKILKTTYKFIDEDIRNFFLADISHWNRTQEEIFEVERLMFEEYQMVDFCTYRTERIKILNDLKAKDLPIDFNKGIELSISWLKSFKPKIGWFCGSFNPFTVGHFDILKKAEKMFDKVVIVQGVNPSKEKSDYSLKQLSKLKKYEIIENVKDIPKLISECGYKPTLIRGIRNNDDVLDSQNWIAYIKEFVDVECSLIIGDAKLNHISSSFVRSLKTFEYSTKKFIID